MVQAFLLPPLACALFANLPRPVSPRCQAAEASLLRISNKVRFILAVVGGQLRISNRRRAEIEAELEREGYDKLPSGKKKVGRLGPGSRARRLMGGWQGHLFSGVPPAAASAAG